MKSLYENRARKRRYSSNDDESRESRVSVCPNDNKPSNSDSSKSQASRDREIRRHAATRNESRRFEKEQRGARGEERCRQSRSRMRSPVSRKSEGHGFGSESHRDQSSRRKSPCSGSSRRDYRGDRDSREKSPYRRRTDNSGNVAHNLRDHRTTSLVDRRAERSGRHAESRRDRDEDRHYEERRCPDKYRTRSPMIKRSDGWDKLNTSDFTTTKRSRDTISKSPDSQRSRSPEAPSRRSESPEVGVEDQWRRYQSIMEAINRRNNKAIALEIGAEFSPKPLRDPAQPNEAPIWELDGKNQEERVELGKSRSGSGQGLSLSTPPPGSPIPHNMIDEPDVIYLSSDDETEDAGFIPHNMLDEPDVIYLSSDDETEDAGFKYDTTPPREELNAMTDEEKAKYASAMEVRKRRQHQQEIYELPVSFEGLYGCRHITEYNLLNKIHNGTYGEVFRGKHTRTDEIVALKRLNLEYEESEFPLFPLREIEMLLKADDHENVVNVKEVLLGRTVFDAYVAMEYMDNDVKNWMNALKDNGKRFPTGHTKNLVRQLLQGISHLHDFGILHRNLKTRNLLISSSRVLKIAGFGLAREFVKSNDTEKQMEMTVRVGTLWYRSPELLLHPITYSTPVDMWSVGCIMAEFITMHPLLPAYDEVKQLDLIFRMMSTPSEKTWPTINELRLWKSVTYPVYKRGELRRKFLETKLLDESGFDLLSGLLTMDPSQRLTASQALKHPWFNEYPRPVPNENLPFIQATGNLVPVYEQTSNRKSRLDKFLENQIPHQSEIFRQFDVKADQVKTSDFQLEF